MSNDINRLTRVLFENSRMELKFFMYLPSGIPNGNSNLLISCNPVVYLRYKPPKNISVEYDFMKAAFKITPKNLYTTIEFFNTIVKWFYDDKYNDLFLINENGELIFNADYNKLSVSTPRGDYDTCIMQAIPTVIRIGDKTYEGIHLYVNKSQYCISLTFQEIGILFGILKDLSFTNEITNSLLSYQIIKENGLYAAKEYSGKTPFDV